ncbi:MAG TPA: hopanoid-associated sugar epimerase [Xanthobacteraceae bacterium]|jgi:dihydroflavonol-4-reductase|nr:hopanoid-associated sugar epimerase [Xanthobacteraceae bacterium]
MNESADHKADSVLVTGATGFVGSAIANAARAAGYRVRVLARVSSPRTNLSPADEITIGDLCDRASLDPALQGVRYLFHTAADYRLWSRDPGEIMRSNLEGTRNVMDAALTAGVERIVYTSSVAVLALRDGVLADESCSLPEEKAIGAYKKSKVLAELLVHDMIARQRLPAVIVNPSTPIGPRDVKPTPTGRIIVECASGRMPGYVETGLNLVHVDDVAQGHLAALRTGRIGERYILGGENVRLSDMLTTIAAQAGRRRPWLRLPIAPLYPVAYAAEWWASLTGSQPFATRDGLKMARHHMYFDDAKARRELGYSSRPHQDAIADAINWFKQAGYVR